jgi:hypothetical protein
LHVTTAQSHPRNLLQLVTSSTLLNLLLLLEGLSLIETC